VSEGLCLHILDVVRGQQGIERFLERRTAVENLFGAGRERLRQARELEHVVVVEVVADDGEGKLARFRAFLKWMRRIGLSDLNRGVWFLVFGTPVCYRGHAQDRKPQREPAFQAWQIILRSHDVVKHGDVG
jgi:hypothetical protein